MRFSRSIWTVHERFVRIPEDYCVSRSGSRRRTWSKVVAALFYRQQGWRGAAIRAAALLGVVPIVDVLDALVLDSLPRLGLAPCEDRDLLTLAAHGLEAILLAVCVWAQLRALRHPTYAALLAALVIPVATWLIRDAASARDASRERQCVARPLEDAMKACRADPAVYRLGKSPYGNVTVTLFAPGRTDRAWRCLSRWSDLNGKVSIRVDDSIYGAYRKIDRKPR